MDPFHLLPRACTRYQNHKGKADWQPGIRPPPDPGLPSLEDGCPTSHIWWTETFLARATSRQYN